MPITKTYPGVYFETIDDSAYTLGFANDSKIGLVGDFQKGPALTWIKVANWGEFKEIFGGLSSETYGLTTDGLSQYYGPQAAKTLLSETDELYVYRLLKTGAAYAQTTDLGAQDGGNSSGLKFQLLSAGGGDDQEYKPENRPVYLIEASSTVAPGGGPRQYNLYIYESDQYYNASATTALAGLTFNGYDFWGADASNLKAKEVFKNVVFLNDPTSGISVLDAVGSDGRGQVSSLIKVVIDNATTWASFNTTGTGLLEAGYPYGSFFASNPIAASDQGSVFDGGTGIRMDTDPRDLADLHADASNVDGLADGLDIMIMPDAHLSSAAGDVATAVDSLETVAEAYGAIAVVTAPDSNTVGTLTDWAIARNSSFAAAYTPWVSVYTTDGYKYHPADGWVAKAYLYTDRVNWPWFAPAGAKRGALGDISPKYIFTEANQEDMYDSGVNVIRNLPGYGPVVWGQKTTQQKNTALDRVNVRRLMNYLQKKVEEYSSDYLFEPNDSITWSKLSARVVALMENVKAESGVYDYRVIIDETTNTAAVIDQNKLAGKIFIKPTKTAEVIAISFTISGSGASFE